MTIENSLEIFMDDSQFIAAQMFEPAIYTCSGISVMSGVGRLRDENELDLQTPEVACDGRSEPLPLELRTLTFTRDAETDILTDNFGGVWTRESVGPSPERTTPASEEEVTELLNGFIEARVAGEGAQLHLNDPARDIPLLYATTSGAPYDRGEFERVLGVEWPYGNAGFKVRLYAGDTVVEQLFFLGPEGRLGLTYMGNGFTTDIPPTTEGGQPVLQSRDIFDGEVTLRYAHPWISTGGDALRLIPKGARPTTDGGERIDWETLVPVVDPVTIPPACRSGIEAANAAALAEIIGSQPGLETTAPVAIGGGGARGLRIDVVIANPTTPCSKLVLRLLSANHWLELGYRMRLYLFNAPAGSSMRILAIPVVVPEPDFERAAEAADRIEVEFHAP
jgi:hypothetical protein